MIKKVLFDAGIVICLLGFIFVASIVQEAVAAQVIQDEGVELLPEEGLVLSAQSDSVEARLPISDDLVGVTYLSVTLDLNGMCVLIGEEDEGNDASALFIQTSAEWKYVNISSLPELVNCFDGAQTLNIPLSLFWNKEGTRQFNPALPFSDLGARFFGYTPFRVDFLSVKAVKQALPSC